MVSLAPSPDRDDLVEKGSLSGYHREKIGALFTRFFGFEAT